MKPVYVAVCVMFLALLTACSGTATPEQPVAASRTVVQPANPAATAATELIKVVPDFRFYHACGRPCWLPVQPEPKAKPGRHINKPGWPYENFGEQHGDKLTLVCKTDAAKGKSIKQLDKSQWAQDDRGVSSTVWYRVQVPKGRIRPGMLNSAPRLNGGRGKGYYGYVNSLWIWPAHKDVPACSD